MATPHILTLNGGSSSIRYAIFDADAEPRRCAEGRITVGDDHRAAMRALTAALESAPAFASVVAAGHRVVHGMKHADPRRVTPRLLAELRRTTPYAPEHLPRELALIDLIARRHRRMRQVACFDTAFHRAMPPVARRLPIPRRFATKGVERYGFHGLSYSYLMEELRRIDPAGATGRVILAHLGGGASLAAVRAGTSIDTSMGFTPAAGLMMGTRTGDIDPGLAYHMARTARMSAARFQRMVNHESGLLGVSQTSADMRTLLACETTDARAAEAIELFCYQATKWIGAFAAVLGGVDTLVFSGGIGEHAPAIRQRICDRLAFLGIAADRQRNARNAPVISPEGGPVTVRVIATDEELMIARSVVRVLRLAPASQPT